MDLNFYKGKTVLVTGDTGFKGSWLSLWLLSLGARVFGYALPPKKGSILMRADLQKIEHVDGDIRDARRLKKIIIANKTRKSLFILPHNRLSLNRIKIRSKHLKLM